MLADTDTVLWAPQPGPQALLVQCPVFEVLFGGARGGGKTDSMLGDWLIHANQYGRHANGIMFRRTLIALEETIERARELFEPLGALYNVQTKTFKFPSGARIKFRFLDRDEDASRYQGHSYTRVYVEEITQFPSPAPIMKLMATLRSAAGVSCAFRATANPGGPGHTWVKKRYIDPWPAGLRIVREADERTGLMMERMYIPSKVADNQILMARDPFYVARLAQSGSAQLVKAWLDGDWSVIEGAYFDCWSDKLHVRRPHPLPAHWTRYRSFDWGSSRPFCCIWWAVSDGNVIRLPDRPREQWPIYPKGALIAYREWYGSPDNSNTGLKMPNEEIGFGIASRTTAAEMKTMRPMICDSSIFDSMGGPSIAEQMHKGGKFMMVKADKTRIPGWQQVRTRLIGRSDGDDAGKPMIYFFANCINTIRTLPALQHDKTNVEDVDSEGEDHAGDTVRYMCNARPLVSKFAPGAGALPLGRPPTIDEVIAFEQGGGTRRNMERSV